MLNEPEALFPDKKNDEQEAGDDERRNQHCRHVKRRHGSDDSHRDGHGQLQAKVNQDEFNGVPHGTYGSL